MASLPIPAQMSTFYWNSMKNKKQHKTVTSFSPMVVFVWISWKMKTDAQESIAHQHGRWAVLPLPLHPRQQQGGSVLSCPREGLGDGTQSPRALVLEGLRWQRTAPGWCQTLLVWGIWNATGRSGCQVEHGDVRYLPYFATRRVGGRDAVLVRKQLFYLNIWCTRLKHLFSIVIQINAVIINLVLVSHPAPIYRRGARKEPKWNLCKPLF